jgi:hypothetical protein
VDQRLVGHTCGTDTSRRNGSRLSCPVHEALHQMEEDDGEAVIKAIQRQ